MDNRVECRVQGILSSNKEFLMEPSVGGLPPGSSIRPVEDKLSVSTLRSHCLSDSSHSLLQRDSHRS
jgi:hypothetical protein